MVVAFMQQFMTRRWTETSGIQILIEQQVCFTYISFSCFSFILKIKAHTHQISMRKMLELIKVNTSRKQQNHQETMQLCSIQTMP